jgi:hypothetical protein
MGTRNEYDRKLNALLAELLATHHSWDSADKRWTFNSAGFYRDWFRGRHSTPYFFLFRKNLAVTNLQFAELLALLRTYTTQSSDGSRPHLQFYSTDEFNRQVLNLLNSLADRFPPGAADDKEPVTNLCKEFANHWGELVNRTVVIDAFYGSCVSFFPPGLDLDLGTVCGVSGYIHSCGPSVWARKVGKAEPKELISKLAVRAGKDKRRRAMFAVYSHEDFTEFDREEASDLRNGLDEVKIWVGKYWMKDERLSSFLNKLRENVPALEVAGSGDYRKIRQDLHDREGFDRDRCFWLIVDRGVSTDGQHPSRERYYHCYEQHFCNESALHGFDENKPAWRSHTTLPHTLTGAMLNLTLPHWPSGKVRLIDPFVGTGTTLLEAAKFPNLSGKGIDSDPLVPLLVRDNVHFFTIGHAPLRSLRAFLGQVIELQKKRGEHALPDAELTDPASWLGEIEDEDIQILFATEDQIKVALAAHQKAELMVTPVAEHPDREITISDPEVGELEDDWSFDERLLFYIALRAVRRNVGARSDEDEARYRRAWLNEAQLLWRQIDHLLKRREKPIEDSKESVQVFEGFYSRAISGSLSGLKRLAEQPGFVQHGDARSFEGHFDLIVTDPPYGFNTDGHSDDLAELFNDILKRSLERLNDGGQIVMALPEQSFIGRDPAFFADRRFVEQQVAAAAHGLGRELVTSAEVVPSQPPIFKGPYYWESERALRRSIVHYRIGRRARENSEGSKDVETRPDAPRSGRP